MTRLRNDIRTLAQAVAGKNYAAAGAALTTLNTDIAAAHAAGTLGEAKLARIRAAVITVQADLASATAARTEGLLAHTVSRPACLAGKPRAG